MYRPPEDGPDGPWIDMKARKTREVRERTQWKEGIAVLPQTLSRSDKAK